MASIANAEIRKAAKTAGIHLWQIAEALGINDSNFSRKLRRELPDVERQRILAIIEDIAAEQHTQEGGQ